jgi:hypothetical protein
MAQALAGKEKSRDLIRDGDVPTAYRFARTHGRRARVGARTAWRHAGGFLQSMIAAIADSKLRRLERELELRNVRYDRPSNDRVTRDSDRAVAGED